MSGRKLIVGLGNPGPKYDGTRHNVGFEVVDRLASGPGGSAASKKFDGLLAEAELDFRRVLLLKPQTYMNLSGRSVRQAVQFYKIEPAEDLLVVCDDISLPLGKLRIRPKGSDGGQKGLRDIIAQLGTQDFPRLRIGVGDPGPIDAADYVLGRWRNTERPVIDDALISATQAVAVWVSQGLESAMNRFNAAAGG
ncbi:aminoacyl-tRNA hydrolase [Tautonia plasticadhaerens]|uniref:Peptidyl-tRNA hydrolase n=1 Tax=Tautonia plasticadhaerens TaxID=2527974 RepID=A0A518GX49_9BACT|nr:aminoacyl-tRNA hydrolase [Tautonia plasticadhaerens]QDV33169.1 Peptidyl-tRNA hydrolase [Tautonia plasticadhaerens]